MKSKQIKREEEWLTEHLTGLADHKHLCLGTSGDIDVDYISSLCDSELINRYVVVPAYDMDSTDNYEKYIASFPGSKQAEDMKQALESIMQGFTAIRISGGPLYLFDAKKVEAKGISDAINESIVQGPNVAFGDSLETNMNLIRHRYQSDSLKMELQTIGKVSKTSVAIMYDADRVDQDVLEEVKKKVSSVSVDILQYASELQKYITDQKFPLFPTMIITERPDRVVFNLAEGKIAILINSQGFAILVPCIFNDFFTAMDDKIQFPLVAWFIKGIRYIGLFMTMLLPAFYVSFSSYNPEILKVQLSLLIAGSRGAVPYPSFMEVFLMLLMMEFLTEASLRLPKAIGPTATTVGGLILGQAATQAGLVSNIMIILVSAVAISNFIIPLSMMGYTIRVLKYVIVVLAIFFGLIGIIISMVGLIMYLSALRSFGKPYFKIFGLEHSAGKDK